MKMMRYSSSEPLALLQKFSVFGDSAAVSVHPVRDPEARAGRQFFFTALWPIKVDG
jgi:hypothetical protein